MTYSIRGMWRAHRGKAPIIIDALKMVNQAITSQEGFSNGKIYADMTGTFDTVVWQFEAESLDHFFQIERGMVAHPDADSQKLIDILSENTFEGNRQIWEVIV